MAFLLSGCENSLLFAQQLSTRDALRDATVTSFICTCMLWVWPVVPANRQLTMTACEMMQDVSLLNFWLKTKKCTFCIVNFDAWPMFRVPTVHTCITDLFYCLHFTINIYSARSRWSSMWQMLYWNLLKICSLAMNLSDPSTRIIHYLLKSNVLSVLLKEGGGCIFESCDISLKNTVICFCAASIRERLLIESGVY